MWRRGIPSALACLAGLALNVYLWRPFFPYVFARSNNDFVMVYTGAVVAGSPGLYDAATIVKTQHSFGESRNSWFIRAGRVLHL